MLLRLHVRTSSHVTERIERAPPRPPWPACAYARSGSAAAGTRRRSNPIRIPRVYRSPTPFRRSARYLGIERIDTGPAANPMRVPVSTSLPSRMA